MNQQSGKYIIIAGICIIAVGLLIYFFHNKLTWLGRLPGDIKIERENFRFYLPLATMVVLSLLLTLIINIIRRF
jgi:H+/Cl- antiporter ClcA